MLRLATLAAACAIATPAFAWDYPGHRMVGWIADLVLQQHYPNTRKKVSALLDIKDASGNVTDRRFLREVAVFPDCAKNEEEFCGRGPSQEEIDYAARNKEHRGYHFTNTPLQLDKYDPDGKWAKPTDIVHMIAYTVAQLKGAMPATQPKDVVNLTDTEALWLLTHLVGDIHQPLHVGAKFYDATCEKDADLSKDEPVAVTLGGNRIEIPAAPPAVPVAPNLHIYWDAAAVARAMKSTGVAGAEQEFARLLASSPPAGWKTEGAPETWASQWATEILPLARQAHGLLAIRKSAKVSFPTTSAACMWETTMDPSYQDWAKEVARAQIAKAGFRLAALLVEIFPN